MIDAGMRSGSMRATYDLNGRLQHPNLHDGLLQAIAVSDDDVLSLRCKSVDGQVYQVIVPKLISLRADNFLQGNIIFDLTVHGSDRCTADLATRIEGHSGVDVTRQDAERRMSDIARHGWSVLELDSSYGCELLAVFDGVERDIVFELLGSEQAA